ncbi:hypothetical protein [Streptomyces sp. NPDC002078]
MAVPLTRARSGTVIEPSSLGIVTEQADLPRGLHFAGVACPWHPGITTCYR